jgi:hypothetical protein
MGEKYEVGGRVRISGKWYKIVRADEQPGILPVRVAFAKDYFGQDYEMWIPAGFIEEYDAPEFNWLAQEDCDAWLNNNGATSSIKFYNRILTQRYGKPPASLDEDREPLMDREQKLEMQAEGMER